MSHFAVAVITDTQPTEAELAAVLQPFHEFARSVTRATRPTRVVASSTLRCSTSDRTND